MDQEVFGQGDTVGEGGGESKGHESAFSGHEGLREFWTSYRSTFGEMRSEFRNVLATEEGAALEWTTEGASNGDPVSYDGVSILEIEGGKVRRFMAYFDTRDLTPQVVVTPR